MDGRPSARTRTRPGTPAPAPTCRSAKERASHQLPRLWQCPSCQEAPCLPSSRADLVEAKGIVRLWVRRWMAAPTFSLWWRACRLPGPRTTRSSVLSRGHDHVFEEGIGYHLVIHLCKSRSLSVNGDITWTLAVSRAILMCFSARFLLFSPFLFALHWVRWGRAVSEPCGG